MIAESAEEKKNRLIEERRKALEKHINEDMGLHLSLIAEYVERKVGLLTIVFL